jgi:MFS family permease
MIVIPVWVPYLATLGITMRQFMELQAVFALVILCGEVPSGLLSDLWGRKKTLLVGSTLKAISFSLLPLWSSYEGFLFHQFGLLIQIGRGLGDVLFLNALNEKISSAFRTTVISMVQLGTRASFALLGPLVGYGLDAWGLPSVLSALGILFSIAFVFLLLPLVLRETAPSLTDELRA